MLGTAATSAAGDDTADRAQLHSSRRIHAMSDLTLVTLECTAVDIAMSVVERGDVVYSPRVLVLRSQRRFHSPAAQCGGSWT